MSDDSSHAAAVEAWRQQRYAALRREIGWLTLTGLDWLHPGVNTLGTDAAADIVLPQGPAAAGTITLRDGIAVAEGPIAGGSAIRMVSDA